MSSPAQTVIWQANPLGAQKTAVPPLMTGCVADSVADSKATPPSTRVSGGLVPFNPHFNDIYRSSGTNGLGGLDQARHVFLSGCGLLGENALWRDQSQWRILETGFGLGLNFLATWLAWTKDPHAPALLHYVSVEAHPVKADDLLQSVQDWPELHDLAQELAQAYWGMLPGFHKILLAQGRVHLTVIVADVQEALKTLEGVFDSVYLDGFSPLKNPQMWSALTLKGVSSHCRIGTQVATWSVAKSVKEGLKSIGFEVKIAPGLAPKREQLSATYQPHWLTQGGMGDPQSQDPMDAPNEPARQTSMQAHSQIDKCCVIIGAGLAGASVAQSLALRGWRVRVVDARLPSHAQSPSGVGWDDQARPMADGAHGLPVAMFHPMFTGDENLQSRLIRAGIRVLLGYLHLLDPNSSLGLHQVTGVLEYKKPSKSSLDPRALARLGAERLAAPFYSDWTQDANAAQSSKSINDGSTSENSAELTALWHRPAGWVKPQALIERLLKHPNIECVHHPVLQIIDNSRKDGGRWRVLLGSQGGGSTPEELECSNLIVAAGPHTQALLSGLNSNPEDVSDPALSLELQHLSQTWPLQAIKGQITMGWMSDLHPQKTNIQTNFPEEMTTLPHATNLTHTTNLPHSTTLPSATTLPYSLNLPDASHLPFLPPLPKPSSGLPAFAVHGSISWTPNIDLKSPKGLAFFVGSTFERDQSRIQNSPSSRSRNWTHLQSMFPSLVNFKPQDAKLYDWSGVRSTCPDRVPLCGPLRAKRPGNPSASEETGLFVVSALGSRGVALCTLMAEVLSAHMNGEPQALPKRLLKAIDPMRFQVLYNQ